MSLPHPPIAEIEPVEKVCHGVTLSDPYGWLKDPNYPDVQDERILAYLKQENAYFDAAMAPEKQLIKDLFEEIKARVKEDDSSVPARDGEYEYWWAFDKGADYRRWFRRPAGGDGAEALIFDEPARAEGHEYYDLGALEVSPDATELAFAEDTDGSERYVIRVMRLDGGQVLRDSVYNTSGAAVWSADGKGFFYVEKSKTLRPYRVMYHRLGAPTSADSILFEEADQGFFVGIGRTRSREYLVIGTGDHVTTEIRLLSLNDPEGEPAMISPRRVGHQYDLDHAGKYFFIRTNDSHKNFRIVRAPVALPQEETWEEIVAPSDDSYIRYLSAFRDFLVIGTRGDAADKILLRGHEGESHRVEFPEAASSAALGDNREFATGTLRLNYQSMVTPATVFDYDVSARTLETRKVQEIPSGYDADAFQTERLWATARDGTKVPVTLLTRKDFKMHGGAPLHLTGYGAYGLGSMPRFSVARLSLVERGFAYAVAHIRGGDEMGYGWYEAGKLQARTNTFNDFIDAAEFLIEEGYADRGRISISGGSAGGELMGYVLNAAPELWGAAVAHVPFVDVLNTMLDDSLPLTPMEWPEWGNPIKDEKAFELIRSYSPYDNVRRQDYPPIFVTAGLNDPRVTYWEPAKWVAKLRASKTDSNLLLLKTNMGHGHFGKSGRYEAFHEVAEEYAFILKILGSTGGNRDDTDGNKSDI